MQSKSQFNLRKIAIGTAVLAATLCAGNWAAHADAGRLITLKQVQATDESQVSILFDGKISASQIQTDYFNDIVQLSLKDVSVYPAKISSVNSAVLSKIFAYQYAPKLVRCRFTVKGRAEALKDKLKIEANGKALTIRFPAVPPAEAVAEKATPVEKPADRASEVPAVASSESQPLDHVGRGKSVQPIAGGKPLPSPFGALGKLAAVLAVFGAIAIGASKLRNKNGKLMSALGKFANGTLARKGKMIEVVSTHHLGPKKSIAVVKVAGRLLVLGVSNDSINLITQIAEGKSEADLEELLMSDDIKPEAAFSALLGAEQTRPAGAGAASNAVAPKPLPPLAPASASPAVAVAASARANSARDRIKSRLEGLKQL